MGDPETTGAVQRFSVGKGYDSRMSDNAQQAFDPGYFEQVDAWRDWLGIREADGISLAPCEAKRNMGLDAETRSIRLWLRRRGAFGAPFSVALAAKRYAAAYRVAGNFAGHIHFEVMAIVLDRVNEAQVAAFDGSLQR